MFDPYKNENLYIAGPECFYRRGYSLWYAQRGLAEYYGIPVVLPTSTELKLNHKDKRDDAKEIFDDLIVQVSKTTAIIADLELYRGSEPDGGTIFELGWIYSKGGRLYGYSRDNRDVRVKNQRAVLRDNVIYDENGWIHPYPYLPYAPTVTASTTLIEGDFKAALLRYIADLDDERKGITRTMPQPLKLDLKGDKILYYSSPDRYSPSSTERLEEIRRLGSLYGFTVVSPCDALDCEIEAEDPYQEAAYILQKNIALIDAATYFVADLSDYHGWECQSDVSFECGYAYGKNKRCIGFTPDARKTQERIPHFKGINDNVDWCGNVVENFDYPLNLMFSCSMKIVEGDFEEAIKEL